MSLTSRMLVKILQLSGMKGKLAKGSQKTFEEAVSYNRKRIQEIKRFGRR